MPSFVSIFLTLNTGGPTLMLSGILYIAISDYTVLLLGFIIHKTMVGLITKVDNPYKTISKVKLVGGWQVKEGIALKKSLVLNNQSNIDVRKERTNKQ